MTDPTLNRPSDDNLQQQLDVHFALQAAELGIWEYNSTTDLVHWDAADKRSDQPSAQ